MVRVLVGRWRMYYVYESPHNGRSTRVCVCLWGGVLTFSFERNISLHFLCDFIPRWKSIYLITNDLKQHKKNASKSLLLFYHPHETHWDQACCTCSCLKDRIPQWNQNFLSILDQKPPQSNRTFPSGDEALKAKVSLFRPSQIVFPCVPAGPAQRSSLHWAET